MNKLYQVKKFAKRILILFLVVFAIIGIAFAFHVIQINRDNSMERKYTSDSVSMDVTADIHPRGLLTDSWEKNDAFPGTIIYGKIYEATIVNDSRALLTDWRLRVNIKEDCYLNNAWNGKMEIHQFDNSDEIVQTIDLRNYDADDIKLNYYMAGQDLLIPLKNGDYFVYLPDDSPNFGEVPLKSSSDFAGETNIGFILYSNTGDEDLSDYVMTYHIQRSYFSGVAGIFFLVIIPTWFLLTIIYMLIAWIVVGFEGTVYRQKRIIDDMFEVCSTLADEKDYYHKNHSNRVAIYSRKIAEAMGMDKQDCEIVYYSALLHNIGNYAVPERILSKTTKLTEDDEKIVQNHTIKGAKLLEGMKTIPQSASAALYHHERYDGNGYPMGKKGDEIPLVARIIAVADAYDDMNHDRVYRKKYTIQEMKTKFKEDSGTWFDPFVVDVFMEIIDGIED